MNKISKAVQFARTVDQVNHALKAAGIDAEIVRGNGYLYFTGPGLESWFTTSVPVCYLSQKKVAGWVQAYRDLEDMQERRDKGLIA